jgi:hypothetical protein
MKCGLESVHYKEGVFGEKTMRIHKNLSIISFLWMVVVLLLFTAIERFDCYWTSFETSN